MVAARARELGLSRTDLVRRLGYRDLAGGHRVLNSILSTGIVPRTTHIARHLAATVEVDDRLLIAVIEATEWQRRDEHRAQVLAREAAYRAAFKPSLRAETARRRPEPLFVVALFGVARLRNVPLPDEASHIDVGQRDALVKRAILEHYRAQNGHIPAFGSIIGYKLVTIPGYERDFGFPYDLDGARSGPMCAIERLPQASLGTKGGDTTLTGLFKDVPIKTIPFRPSE